MPLRMNFRIFFCAVFAYNNTTNEQWLQSPQVIEQVNWPIIDFHN